MLVAVWGGLASIAGSAARAGGRILSISVTSPVPASHSRSKYKVVRMWPTGAETSTKEKEGLARMTSEPRAQVILFLLMLRRARAMWGWGGLFAHLIFSGGDEKWRGGLSAKRGGAESNCHLVTDYLTAMPANVIVVDTHDPNWLLICTLTNIALPSSYNIGRALLILCQLLLRTLRVKCPLCLSLQSKFLTNDFFCLASNFWVE